MSIGPWPISALPFHVPTSVFNRSNSGELAFTLTGSLAYNHVAPASTNIAQTEVILIFIFVVLLFFRLSSLQRTSPGLQDNDFVFFPRTPHRELDSPFRVTNYSH